MNELQNYCTQQLEQLNSLILECQNHLQLAPQGSLRISTQRDHPRYYWLHSNNPKQGDYIKKNNLEFAKQLAQKDYLEKLLESALEKRKQLEKTTFLYNWDELAFLHKQLSNLRQTLVQPIILSNSEYATKWEQQQFKLKSQITSNGNFNTYPLTNDIGIETEKGEFVRSKSEKIIADKLYKMNIPYIYEMPLFLQNTGYIFPDFLVLNIRTREIFYWEHFGMMDKEDYCNHTLKKLTVYEQNGIYQGRKLITSYESSTHILNTKTLEQLINEFLL